MAARFTRGMVLPPEWEARRRARGCRATRPDRAAIGSSTSTTRLSSEQARSFDLGPLERRTIGMEPLRPSRRRSSSRRSLEYGEWRIPDSSAVVRLQPDTEPPAGSRLRSQRRHRHDPGRDCQRCRRRDVVEDHPDSRHRQSGRRRVSDGNQQRPGGTVDADGGNTSRLAGCVAQRDRDLCGVRRRRVPAAFRLSGCHWPTKPGFLRHVRLPRSPCSEWVPAGLTFRTGVGWLPDWRCWRSAPSPVSSRTRSGQPLQHSSAGRPSRMRLLAIACHFASTRKAALDLHQCSGYWRCASW